MNIDEAIKHCIEKAKECKGTECGLDHIQLAKWLAELRSYRNLANSVHSFLNVNENNRYNFTEEEITLLKGK